MALHYSTGFRNAIASNRSWAEALSNGRLFIYTGSIPASADDDISGTQLLVFTVGGGTFTAPVASSAMFTIAGGSGSIDTVKIGGMDFNLLSAAVPYNTSTTQTALDVVDNINARVNPFGITAVRSSSDVQLYLPDDLGALGNGLTVAVTSTTLTANVNGGGDQSGAFGEAGSPTTEVTAVNGLNFGVASSGVISKTADAWSAIATATGTAAWFRYVAGGGSPTGSSSTAIRVDGTIATSGADLNVATTSITASSTQTISSFTITIPA